MDKLRVMKECGYTPFYGGLDCVHGSERLSVPESDNGHRVGVQHLDITDITGTLAVLCPVWQVDYRGQHSAGCPRISYYVSANGASMENLTKTELLV